MKLATTTFPLTLLTAISLLPSSSAWKFTWHDEDGNQSTESGKGPHTCVKIEHAQGERYVWDNQGNENIGIYLYTSSDCSGSLAGWSSAKWEKESSRDLLGFKVMNEGASTTESATGSSQTASSASAASSTATTQIRGGASNSTSSGSSSAVGSKTKTSASATGSSSAASSQTASTSHVESTSSSTTATGQSGSSSPSPTASATDGGSTDESSASSLSRNTAVQVLAGLVLGLTGFEWLF